MRVSWLYSLVVLLAGSMAQAGGHSCGPGCAPAACGPQYQLVQKTVMVPTWVTEMRTVYVTQCVPEERHKTVTVKKSVPVVRQVTKAYTVLVPEVRSRTVEYDVCRTVWQDQPQEYAVNIPYQESRQAVRTVCQWVDAQATRTVMVPEVRTKVVNYTVCRPVWREEVREYTVNVPYQVTKTGVRKVCRSVPVNYSRTIRVDHGCWQTVACEAPACGPCGSHGCGSCGGYSSCALCRRVWVPNWCDKVINYTCYKQEPYDVPYDYQVTLCRPETRTATVKVCDVVQEPQSKEVQYTVCVPREEVYTVKKPHHVQIPYDYTVNLCRTETRTRMVKVAHQMVDRASREVPYTVCVPQTREKTYNVTDYQCVEEPRDVCYTVMVPHQVPKQVCCKVKQMVPKTITCRVPVCAPSAACSSCY